MELSIRLNKIASMVTEDRIADIGTDHAYIPIFLLLNRKINHALAMDVNEGPLKIAEKNCREYGIEDRIELRRSDGFSAMLPGEAQTAILAGMGGPLMKRIIENDFDKVLSLQSLILQPQSEIEAFRKFLLDYGFHFLREEMVIDEGKYYFLMKVSPPALPVKGEAMWSAVELRYGKLLLDTGNEVLHQYLLKERRTYTEILAEFAKGCTDRIVERKREINQLLLVNEEALRRIEKGQ